jgi:RNA polymerase sigma-70 factor (ECF subfamily)
MSGEQTVCAPSIDEILVAEAKAGEQSAFAELWNRHSKRAFRTLCRITRNQQDAEDALQDTFLKAFVHLNSFNSQAAFSTWLTRIAINSALMIIRKRRTYPHISMEWSTDGETWEQYDTPGPGADVETLYLLQEQRERLWQAINRLHPVVRDIFEMRYASDRSIHETAELAGITLAATKSRLQRGRRELLRSLR